MAKKLPPKWYESTGDLTATIDLDPIKPGTKFPVREPATNAFAPVAKLLTSGTANFYDAASLGLIMLTFFDDGGQGGEGWPAKNAKASEWTSAAAALPKSASDRIASGVLVWFNQRFLEDDSGNE